MSERLTPEQADKVRRLLWPHLAMMLRVARYFTRDEHEAEDLVQETVMKAMRSIDRFKEGADIQSWLLTIERRAFIDRYRSRQREHVAASLEAVSEPAGAESADEWSAAYAAWTQPEMLMQRFDDEQVIHALEELPQEIRWTLLLVDVEQLDQADAASILEVPVGTIKSRAHRGRQMLREKLLNVAQQRGWTAKTDIKR